jgi:hypothetical protein
MSIERYQGWAWLCCEHGDGLCDAETGSVLGPNGSNADRTDLVAMARREGWAVREDVNVDLCPKLRAAQG